MARKVVRSVNDLFVTRALIERIAELAGAADVTAHEAAGDPHSQYATDADLTAHGAAADPHTQYLETDDYEDGTATVWMPLVSIEGGTPQLVLDDDDALIPTRMPT